MSVDVVQATNGSQIRLNGERQGVSPPSLVTITRRAEALPLTGVIQWCSSRILRVTIRCLETIKRIWTIQARMGR